MATLREQFRRAKLAEVEMTGHGFYADFAIPFDVPLTVPSSFAGGNAEITLEGSSAVDGCVLFVREGRLATLDCYTFGDEGWPESARVIAVENVEPVWPDNAT